MVVLAEAVTHILRAANVILSGGLALQDVNVKHGSADDIEYTSEFEKQKGHER
jgi:hypothetical protein